MVNEFSSEQEQVEAITRWLKTHGPSIIIGIVVGLAAIGGWRYWQSYQQDQAEAASAVYAALSDALDADDAAAAGGHAATLKQDYAQSGYATLAALRLASRAAEDGDNEAAIDELRWVLDNAADDAFKPIARLRLARLLFAEQRYDDARAQLNQVGDGHSAEREELSGDLYAAAGQPELARTAYQAAQTAAGGGGPLLRLKIDTLPGAPQPGAPQPAGSQ